MNIQEAMVALKNEIDSRIKGGTWSRGQLEYVQYELGAILSNGKLDFPPPSNEGRLRDAIRAAMNQLEKIGGVGATGPTIEQLDRDGSIAMGESLLRAVYATTQRAWRILESALADTGADKLIENVRQAWTPDGGGDAN